jgi:hypothetical protein
MVVEVIQPHNSDISAAGLLGLDANNGHFGTICKIHRRLVWSRWRGHSLRKLRERSLLLLHPKTHVSDWQRSLCIVIVDIGGNLMLCYF